MESTREILKRYIGLTLYDVDLNPVYIVDVINESEALGHLRAVADIYGIHVGYVDTQSNLIFTNTSERSDPYADLGYN